MKKLYVSGDTGLVTAARGGSSALLRIDAKRGDTLRIEWVFDRELEEGATAIFAAKEDGEYGSDPAVRCAEWTAPDSEGEGYAMEILVASAELAALFAGAEDDASVTLMAELSVSEGGRLLSSQTIALLVRNDVVREDEPEPSLEPMGYIYILNPDTGKKHKVRVIGAGTQGDPVRLSVDDAGETV